MRNAIVLIFLLVGLTISLVPSFAVALLTPPLNPTHKIVGEQFSFMAVKFSWDKSGAVGTSTGANTDTTLNDITKSFTVNKWSGEEVKITGGTGIGQVRSIVSNTATKIIVSPIWSIIPDITSAYEVITSVEWYHLIYSCVQNCPFNPGDALWVTHPIGPGPVSHLFVGGFDYSTVAADTLYQWRVGACSAQAAGDCAYAALQSFETNKAPPPPKLLPPPGGGGGGGIPAILKNPISSQTLPQLLENVLNFLFGLSIVILPIIIIYGGILLLTAGGDPQKISKSRTILLWAVIAFAIILLARGLPPVLRGLL